MLLGLGITGDSERSYSQKKQNLRLSLKLKIASEFKNELKALVNKLYCLSSKVHSLMFLKCSVKLLQYYLVKVKMMESENSKEMGTSTIEVNVFCFSLAYSLILTLHILFFLVLMIQHPCFHQ